MELAGATLRALMGKGLISASDGASSWEKEAANSFSLCLFN